MAGVPPGASTTQTVVVSPVAEGALSPTVPLGAASTTSRQVFLGAASTQSRQVFLGDAPSPSQVKKQEQRISGVKNAQKSRGRRGLDLDLFGDANTAGVPPGAATTQTVVVSPVAEGALSPTVPLGAASTPSRQVFLGAASTQSRQVFLGDAPSSSPVEHQEAEPTISEVKIAQKSRGRRGLDLDSFGDANTAGVPPGAATTQNMVVSPVAATALGPTVPLGAASTQSPQVFPESS